MTAGPIRPVIDPTGWMVIHPKGIPPLHSNPEPREVWSFRHYNLHGLRHPSIFNLFRNARKQQLHTDHYRSENGERTFYAGERFAEFSKILWFDARYLPQIAEDEIIRMEKTAGKRGIDTWRPVFPGLPDQLSELEFAERQMQAWAARAAELRNAAGL